MTGTEVRVTQLDNKQLDIKVPKRTNPGSQLKLQGKGMPNQQWKGRKSYCSCGGCKSQT